MTDKEFNKLWLDALAEINKSLYIEKHTEFNDIIGNIYDVAHMSVRDIIYSVGLTQSEFATKFCIPIRTVEDWCRGKRKCSDYLRLLFCKELNILKIE